MSVERWQLIPVARRFGDFARQWDDLNRRLYDEHALIDSRFVRPLVERFGNHLTTLAVLGDPANPRGMLLLEPKRVGVWRTFLPSQWQVAPVLLAREDAPALLDLPKSMPLDIRLLNIIKQDLRFSPLAAVPQSHPLAEFIERSTSMRIDTCGGFDAYWAARSRSLRKNFKRWIASAERAGLAPRLTMTSDPHGVARGVCEYGLLESAGWKGREGTAVHPDNAQGRFYSEVMGNFARDGCAIYATLHLGERLAASRLLIRSRSQVQILKTTYDETLREFAPGRLLLYMLLERLFDEFPGISVEFYTNADVNQLEWATEPVPVIDVAIYRSVPDRRFITFAREASHRAAEKWRARGAAAQPAEAIRPPAPSSAQPVAQSVPTPDARPVAPRPTTPARPGAVSRIGARVRVDIRALGKLGFAFYYLDRLLRKLAFGNGHLMGMWFYMQPVAGEARARPAPNEHTTIGVVRPGEIPDAAFGRPEGVVAQRFRDGSVCIASRHDDELQGFMWLSFGPLRERLVRCDFEPAVPAATSWDYDFFVAPKYRMGRTFARLWDCANEYLRSRDIRWTGSWIGFTNLASARAHERLGAHRVGWAVFVTIGRVQLTVASMRPWLHVSLGDSSRCRLRIPPARR